MNINQGPSTIWTAFVLGAGSKLVLPFGRNGVVDWLECIGALNPMRGDAVLLNVDVEL